MPVSFVLFLGLACVVVGGYQVLTRKFQGRQVTGLWSGISPRIAKTPEYWERFSLVVGVILSGGGLVLVIVAAVLAA